MSLMQAESLKKTPLYERHLSLQGKIVNFGGWAMPVYYTGILAEHKWTRARVSVFDVSHLGEIRVSGAGAGEFLQYRLTNDLNKMEADASMLYSLLCDEKGFTLDDILIYRWTADDYYLVVNAGNAEHDFEALRRYAPDGVTLTNQSEEMACLALQGPSSESVLEKLLGGGAAGLGYYRFKQHLFKGGPIWISRSGYTGEDGFEIFCGSESAVSLWDRFVLDGREEGVRPAGLGARNTLRLEAGNVLYGNELDAGTTPLEAGLGWAVSFEKGRFVGRDALLRQKERGTARKLVGFRVLDRAVARERYPIFREGQKIGVVTSGSYGPSVGGNIGLGYVRKGAEPPGTLIEVEIHGRRVKAEVVKLPFIPLKHKRSS